MIEWLEKIGILVFHEDIKTHQQKVNAILYALFMILVGLAILILVLCVVPMELR